MSDYLLYTLIIVAIVFVSLAVRYTFRALGKKQGIETTDLEQGVQQITDATVNELNKKKEGE